MHLAHAVLWVTGITLLFWSLHSLAATLRESTQRDLFVGFVCQIAAYSLGVFLLLRLYGPDSSIRQFLALRRTHLGFYPLALLLGVGLVLPTNLLFELSHRLLPQLQPGIDPGQLFAESSTRGRVFMGFAMVVGGPIVEEVLFRGALFGPLLRSHRWPIVVLGTAVTFALVHTDVHALVPILLVGLALGYLRARAGSSMPAMLMHAGFNAIPLLTMIFGPRPADPADPGPLPLVPAALAAVACVGLLLAVRQLSRSSSVARMARSRDA
jgi:membrane protease YdiL (CAAX protease family)